MRPSPARTPCRRSPTLRKARVGPLRKVSSAWTVDVVFAAWDQQGLRAYVRLGLPIKSSTASTAVSLRRPGRDEPGSGTEHNHCHYEGNESHPFTSRGIFVDASFMPKTKRP
jgi:hypothetical protein